MTDFDLFQKFPNQISINIIKKLGTILKGFFSFNDCFLDNRFDGECAGKKLGASFHWILDISSL
jgi:hypothetical protein